MKLTTEEEQKIIWMRGYSSVGILIEDDMMWIVQIVDGGNKDPSLYEAIEIESLETLKDLGETISSFIDKQENK